MGIETSIIELDSGNGHYINSDMEYKEYALQLPVCLSLIDLRLECGSQVENIEFSDVEI